MTYKDCKIKAKLRIRLFRFRVFVLFSVKISDFIFFLFSIAISYYSPGNDVRGSAALRE